MNKMSSLLALTLLPFFTISSYAAVTVYGIEIEGLHQKDGEGEYDQVIENSGVDTRIVVMPPTRADKEFAECTNCCISPMNKDPNFYSVDPSTLQTNPMSVAKVYIFTAKGGDVISSVEALKGKKVGARSGMPYGNDIEKSGIKLSRVSTIEANIKKLNTGRIDALIAYVPDAYAAFESMGIEPLTHDESKPIAVHPDSLVCRDVGDDFFIKFNESL